jgi:cell division protein FtsN
MASGNTKNFELKLGKTGLIIVIVGMAALLCSMFLFGVAVGKNIDDYPAKIASLPQKLLALVWRPAKIRAAQIAAENKTGQNQPKAPEQTDLTFFNTLTSKKGIAQEQQIPDKKPGLESPAATPLLTVPPNDASTVASPPGPELKQQQEATSRPAADEIETKIKESEQAGTAKGAKYAVQVASLKGKTKASQLHKKVATLGYKPRIVENNIAGKGKWYRVVVDGFASRADAQVAADKISSKTGASCAVKRINNTVNGN